jgi:hypothetical protein
MSHRSFFLCLMVLIVAPFAGSDSLADTHYVATHGNDDNPGHSPNSPLRSLAAAALRVQAGDTVLVMEGTYGGFWQNKHGRTDSLDGVHAVSRTSSRDRLLQKQLCRHLAGGADFRMQLCRNSRVSNDRLKSPL